jgi:hypothetical protein
MSDDPASKLPAKPIIHYPCEWEYRIIGADADAMRAAVEEILGERERYTLEEARRSREGRWLSMSLKLTVVNEAHRYELHRVLREHPAVRMVL